MYRRFVCTIAVLFQCCPGAPLVVAANRDELFERETLPPLRLGETAQGHFIVGGRDERAGGTWMAVTAAGFLVAITNQAAMAPRRDALSRGDLVMNALQAGNTADALAQLAKVDGRAYNGFNLLLGDAAALHVAYGRPDRADVIVEAVSAGRHVLGNDALDAVGNPKVQAALSRLHGVDVNQPLKPQLRAVLADHERPPLAEVSAPRGHWLSREMLREVRACCIHTPIYGTRSASFASLAEGRVLALEHAAGPPCVTPFESVAALLQ